MLYVPVHLNFLFNHTKSKFYYIVKSFGENMYSSIRTSYWRAAMSVNHKLAVG